MQQQMVPVSILVDGPAKPEPPPPPMPAAVPPTEQETMDEDERMYKEEAITLRASLNAVAVDMGRLTAKNQSLKQQLDAATGTIQRFSAEFAEMRASLLELERSAAKSEVERNAFEFSNGELVSRCASESSRCQEFEHKSCEEKHGRQQAEAAVMRMQACHSQAVSQARRLALDAVDKSRRWESDAMRRAAKKPATFIDSVNEFYGEHLSRVVAALEGPLTLRAILTGDQAAAMSAADSYVKESKRQLLAVYDTATPEQFASRIEEVTAAWEPRAAALLNETFPLTNGSHDNGSART